MSKNRVENEKVIKDLVASMNKLVDNPRLTDEELEQVVGGLGEMLGDQRRGEKLDTAAKGCPA